MAGGRRQSLTIFAHTFEPGTWYLISLTVVDDTTTYGPAYHEFVTNRPPINGKCKISQYNDTNYYEMSKELKNTTAFPGMN